MAGLEPVNQQPFRSGLVHYHQAGKQASKVCGYSNAGFCVQRNEACNAEWSENIRVPQIPCWRKSPFSTHTQVHTPIEGRWESVVHQHFAKVCKDLCVVSVRPNRTRKISLKHNFLSKSLTVFVQISLGESKKSCYRFFLSKKSHEGETRERVLLRSCAVVNFPY